MSDVAEPAQHVVQAGEFWDQRFSQRPWPVDPDPLLVELATPLLPGRALDVGSGPGRNSLWLAAQGWAVTAVDVSAVALQQAQQRAAMAGLRLRTEQADVLTWPAPIASYELVVLANLHPGEAELSALLRRLVAVLVPGGHLFVVGHDLSNLGRHGPPDPALLLTVERLAAALPAELVVERLERLVRAQPSAGGPATADAAVLVWARVPAVP